MPERRKERLQNFGRALEQALGDGSRKWLAVEVANHTDRDKPYSEAAVGQWINGVAEPEASAVLAMEEIFDLPPGTLSRHLGYLPADAEPVISVVDAIRADLGLSKDAKNILIRAYQGAVETEGG